jgi:hypothetical protein
MRVPTDGSFYPTEDQATLALSALQEECTSALGGGGSFSGSIYKEPVEYNQTTDTYSYLYYLQVSCNTCSSANQTQAIEDYKSTCREQCLSITPLCQAEVWGSTILNTDCDLGLPITTGECAESSSSIESSSSVASSSSVEGGSSASEPGSSTSGQSGGSSTSVHSSASTSVVSTLADVCLQGCSSGDLSQVYSVVPPMDGIPSFDRSWCSSGFFSMHTNISMIAKTTNQCYHSLPCDPDERTIVPAYYCGSNNTSTGCSTGSSYFYCDASTCYVSGGANVVLPSNVSVSQFYALADSAARSVGFSNRAAYADYCKSIYSSSSVEGGSSSSRTPISNSSGTSSGSISGGSSDSAIGNSSSGDAISSSEGSYESSSSGGDETGSSSSASGIDSSCPDCETNVRSANAVYTSDQIFNSGLENMEDGKCYSLNPDRGTQYGWINNNAQDSWWWVETPCEASEWEDACADESSILKKSASTEANSDSVIVKSYEYTFNEPKDFYDVLGRKLSRNVAFDTKRFLFIKPNKVLMGTALTSSENAPTIIRLPLTEGQDSGYVNAFTEGYMHFSIPGDSSKNVCAIIPLDIWVTTTIDTIVHHNVPLLIIHENKHAFIYEKFGNKQWVRRIPWKKTLSYDSTCAILRDTAWIIIEKQVNLMIDKQNEWDDQDSNNVSDARINRDSTIQGIKQKFWEKNPCTYTY